MATSPVPASSRCSDLARAVRIDEEHVLRSACESRGCSCKARAQPLVPCREVEGWALRAPGCGGVRVTGTEARPCSEWPRLETGSLAALLAWVCGLAPSNRAGGADGLSRSPVLRYPGLDLPLTGPGLPSCLHREDPPASVKCLSLPVGCLGSPFRRKLNPVQAHRPPSVNASGGSWRPSRPRPSATPCPPPTLLGFDCTVSAPRWLRSWLRLALLCPAPVRPEARAAALTTSVIFRTSGWAAAPPHRIPSPHTRPESRAPVPAVPVLLRKAWLPQSETSWSDPGRICLHYCEVLFMKNSEGEGTRPRRVEGRWCSSLPLFQQDIACLCHSCPLSPAPSPGTHPHAHHSSPLSLQSHAHLHAYFSRP